MSFIEEYWVKQWLALKWNSEKVILVSLFTETLKLISKGDEARCSAVNAVDLHE